MSSLSLPAFDHFYNYGSYASHSSHLTSSYCARVVALMLGAKYYDHSLHGSMMVLGGHECTSDLWTREAKWPSMSQCHKINERGQGKWGKRGYIQPGPRQVARAREDALSPSPCQPARYSESFVLLCPSTRSWSCREGIEQSHFSARYDIADHTFPPVISLSFSIVFQGGSTKELGCAGRFPY